MSTSTEGKTKTDGAPRDDNRRTTIFVGIAVACLAITAVVEWASRPAEIQEFGKVGQEFYPEFTDPTVATSLSVKVIDTDDLKPLEFSVKQASNGRWVIPSHHDYPADASDQLAETASSVIGIKRGAMVTRWPSDHARYGVVDPETDSVTVDEMEGIGKRLTFRGNDDEVLASYIVGKKVDDQESRYYVRHPSEDETYIAELDIDLSTKFGDWVKTDLLDIDAADVRRIALQDYSFEERGMSLAVTNTVETKLTRESASEDWKMEGLDESTKQVNADAMNETVDTLADLSIAGVRPKQPGLTGDLEIDRSVVASQRDVDRLQADLLSRGFLLQPSKENPEQLRLIAREGEMFVGTADGLVYQLHFGRAFTGSDEELEIGFSSSEGEGDKSTGSDESDDADAGDAESTDEADEGSPESGDTDEATPSGKPGRYVFVRVQVDPALFGEKPNPVEPEKPAELIEAEEQAAEDPAVESGQDASEDEAVVEVSEESDAADEEQSNAAEATDDAGEADGTDADDDEADEQAAEDDEAAEAKLQQLRKAYAEAQQQYEADKQALADYEEKLAAAKESAVELNRRFAQWYYVIPGEEYDNLSLSKEDLVQAKETEDGTPVGEPMPNLQLNLPSADSPGFPIPAAPNTGEQPTETAEPSPPSEPTTDAEPEADSEAETRDNPNSGEEAKKSEQAAPGEQPEAVSEPAEPNGEAEGGGEAESGEDTSSSEEPANSEEAEPSPER